MICRICGCDVTGEGGVACGSCAAPFHRDCWEWNGGCGIYGCGGREEKAWEGAPPEGGALEIREETKPPFRLAPLVEGLVRRLPGWGRAVVPSLVVGLAVGLLIAVFLCMDAWNLPRWEALWKVMGLVLLSSVTVSGLSELTRRRPWLVVGGGLAAQAGGLLALWLGVFQNLPESPTFVAIVLGLVVAAAGVSELLVGSHPRLRRGGTWRGAVLRGGATWATLYVLMLGLGLGVDWSFSLDWASWRPWRFLSDVAGHCVIFSMVGLVAMAPSLALASSPLMHRLKAEARREADEA